ncbi:MAG: DUF3798 domain-containing protein [Deltaproteobacteria bacterium]|jgi:hypothetical protein|nr:DUF3798 domain-containing protein [Deltaproteobacteria bacterium]
METERRRPARIVATAVALALLAAAAAAYLWTGEGTQDAPDLPQADHVSYVVAVAVGPREVYPEENLAVDRLVERFGEDVSGGAIRRVEIPASFETDAQGAAEALLGQRTDLDVRALVAVPAFRGTLGAFAELKRTRPDMLLMASDSREDPGPMSMYSDLTVDPDYVTRAWSLVRAAHALGSRAVVHVSAEIDMESPKARRMLAVMKAAAAGMGMRTEVLDAGPGLGEGSPGAAARAAEWVSGRCRGWVDRHGPRVLYYSPSGPLAEALLTCAAETGGMFLESPRPSPYSFLPDLLGLPGDGGSAARGLDSGGFTELLDSRAAGLPLAGRLGSWPVSYGGEVTEALGALAVKAVTEGGTVTERAFMGTLISGNPAGAWVRRDLTDAATGRRIRKQVLLASGLDVLGGDRFGADEEVPPEYRSVQAPPAPGDETPFLIGILTGTDTQGGDDYLGAMEFERLHGRAGEGGMVRLETYDSEAFLDEMPRTVEILTEMARDPLMKLIVANQAVPGTAEGFRRIKEFRQDILLFAMEPHDDTGTISDDADLVVFQDFIESGYLIVRAARDLGATAFVHVSFPRHMALETAAARHEVMVEAAADLGVAFHDVTAPDPLDPGTDSEKAKAWVAAEYPGWLGRYGRDTAFFATNDSETEALVAAAAEHGGIFVQQDIPSPIMGYSGAFGLDPGGYGYRWQEYVRDLEARIVEAGASGRLGTWVYPLGYCESAGGAEYGRRILMGEAASGDIGALLDSFSLFSGGASWNGSFMADRESGRPIRNFFLVYQDTYVFGRGFLGLPEVEVPPKYRLVWTGKAGGAGNPVARDSGDGTRTEPAGDAASGRAGSEAGAAGEGTSGKSGGDAASGRGDSEAGAAGDGTSG